MRLARTHEIRTFRWGSSLPPHSMALVSSSRKACATDSRTGSGRFGLELHHERLNAVRHLQHARRDQLHPFGPGRHDLDRQRRRRRRGNRVVDDLHDRGRRKGLAEVAVGLLADGCEQRLRRVVGRHHDDDRRRCHGARVREDVEAAQVRQTDIEQHDVERASVEPPQRFAPVGRLIDGVTGVAEQLRQDETGARDRRRRSGCAGGQPCSQPSRAPGKPGR